MKEQQLPLQPNFIDSRKQKRQSLLLYTHTRTKDSEDKILFAVQKREKVSSVQLDKERFSLFPY